MSDNEGTKTGKGWTDRQRLAYCFSLVEFSNVKLDFANAPRPEGKSVGACRIMVDRLKGTLKNELDALRSANGGTPGKSYGAGGAATANKKSPAANKFSTPKKRKGRGDGDRDATPSKRSRKKSAEVVVLDVDGDDDEEFMVMKPKIKNEEDVKEEKIKHEEVEDEI